MARHIYLIASAIFAITFLSIDIAHACLGVSRTVTARSFNANMGMGGSAGLGLRNKEVILTFDDGPKSSTTNRVLQALAAECTKATFFVLGRMARANPKLLQKIARSGHTIAQHTNNHPNLTRLSIAQAENEINRGIASVNLALGGKRRASTRLFRYPYLARSARLDAMLKRKGLLPLSAGIDSNDWKSGSGTAMVNRVMAQLKRKGRGVILLHDIQHKTAKALPLLLRRLKQGGYRVVHLRGSGSPRTNVIASKKQKAKSVQVAALQTKKRKRSFRKRKTNLPGVDAITTGSVKKRTTKRSSKSRLKRKKLEKKVRKGFFARLRERRLERRAQALAAKQSAKKRVKKTNRKLRKKTRVSKRLKKTKKKSWFAKRREARLERAAARKAASKKSRKRKLSKRSKRKSKRVAKKTTKRKSLFGRLFKRVARKKTESDRSFGLRLYDDLLNLEQENKELTKLMKLNELPLDKRPEIQSLLTLLRPLASK